MKGEYHMATMKFAEWESCGHRWNVGLFWKSSVPEKWYVEWRFHKLSFEDYIKMLQSYGAENIKYYPPTDCLIYDFPDKNKAHHFVLEMNKKIRKEGWH
jgi:hypothetical protein